MACMWFFASAILSGCASAPLEETPSLMAVHCNILDQEGRLLWSHPAQLCAFRDDGSYVAADEQNIVYFDREAKPVWSLKIPAHHMISLAGNGDVLSFTSEFRTVSEQKPPFKNFLEADIDRDVYKPSNKVPPEILARKFRADRILRIGPGGKILAEKRLLDDPDFPLDLLVSAPHPEASHVNSIYEIEANASPLAEFKAGNIIVNDTLNQVIFILDPQLRQVLWRLGYGHFGYRIAHDVRVLPNGHLLLFKNFDKELSDSSLDEIDPVQKKIVWSYTNKVPRAFRAVRKGSVQPLRDGTFLAAWPENGKSHAMVVNRQGNVQRTLNLGRHMDMEIQGAYFWPVEKFLKNSAGAGKAQADHLDLQFKESIGARILRVRKTAMNEAEARSTLKANGSLLRRYLERQMDPYTGKVERDSACKAQAHGALTVQDEPGQLSLSGELLAAESFAVDCYGDKTAAFVNRRRYLYCKKQQALFEINLYADMNEPRGKEPIRVQCRN